jgi:hypothetical protein
MASPSAGLIDQSGNAVSRYQDSYRLVRTIVGVSQICKVLGLLSGIMVILFGVMGSETVMRPNPAMVGLASEQMQHNVYLISVIFFGALVALVGWIISVLVAVYGQHLKATLDIAVCGSPFLSNSQRAQIMRLE